MEDVIQHTTANWPDMLENIAKDTLNDVCGRINNTFLVQTEIHSLCELSSRVEFCTFSYRLLYVRILYHSIGPHVLIDWHEIIGISLSISNQQV